MAESEEVLALRRRARRRLTGAAALVLFLVIVPPWLMDLEPKPVTPNLSVEVPRTDAPKMAPPVPPVPQALPAPEAKPPEPAPAPSGVPKASVPAPQPPAAEPVKPKPAPKAPAEDARRAEAALKDESFFIQVGVFSNLDNVKQQMARAEKAGLRVYTEPAKGDKGEALTRVRVGPFSDREAAERARERLKEIGLAPGPVRNK